MVPLTALALKTLEKLTYINSAQGPYLFPARGEPPRPRNKRTLPQAILTYCQATGMPPWTPKDLRRTVKTRMGELRIAKSIRDRVQNHALVNVSTKHYDRNDYLLEKREALETWCSHVQRIVRCVERQSCTGIVRVSAFDIPGVGETVLMGTSP